MALGEALSGRIAIGVGCRRDCPAEAIVAVIRAACAAHDVSGASLFTADTKRRETGLSEAAVTLGLSLAFVPVEELAAVAHRVSHRSPRVLAATGTPSVAEAAALVGAGPGSCLVVPRLAHRAATCAVAVAAEAGS